MDIYRLLTRSTNIQKSNAGTRKISDSQIPSAGHLTDSDAKYGGHVKSQIGAEPTRRNMKRKRIDSVEGQGTDAPGSLSFFIPAADVVNQVKKPITGGGTSSSHMHNDKLREESPVHVEPVSSKEERWRALKRHKLKITVIEDARVRDKGPESSKFVRSGHKDGHLAVQPLLSFELLRNKYSISRRLAENLAAQGYKHPTEVQMGSLPILLGSDEDRDLTKIVAKRSNKESKTEVDLLTVAPTGSGKTLAFMIHIIHNILEERQCIQNDGSEGSQDRHVRAVILAPTHELADQIVNEGRKLAAGTGLRVSALKKGSKLQSDPGDVGDPESEKYREEIDGENERDGASKSSAYVKSDILVSTPLLLLHAISEATTTVRSLPHVRYLILDEADYLLDPLFREQTLSIWNACICPSLRVSLWSATIGSSIESLAQSFILERRQKLGLKSKHHHIIRLVVGLKDSSIPNISHRLTYAASEQGKLLALRQLLHPTGLSSKDIQPLRPPFLIFTQTIPRAIALHSELLYDIPTEAGGASRLAVLHSDLSSAARASIMTGFRKGEIWILITTDLLSRGVDFRGMNGIVNYDIPTSSASYVHRAGRTGRQGREGGVAVTLYTKEDIPYLKGIANVIAASEKLKGGKTITDKETKGLQKWLLDALPDISKKTRKELKVKGVENRRTGAKQEGGREGGREARRTRISTKSGYDRRLENKKKGAAVSSQQRHGQDMRENIFSEDEDWGGFND